MMCDNLSLYKSYIPSSTLFLPTQSTTMTAQFYPMNNDDDDVHRSYINNKRKFSGIFFIKRKCLKFCTKWSILFNEYIFFGFDVKIQYRMSNFLFYGTLVFVVILFESID